MDYLPQRKQLRLKDYDYSSNGMYFITVCTQDRLNLLGQIVGADSISARHEMMLNNAGKMIENIYCNLKNEFKNIILHEYIIMPNHIHGIIEIQCMNAEPRADMESAPTRLQAIIQSFKRYTTIEYTYGVKNNIHPSFNKRIWQRGYYDHIIRNEQELNKIREYIINNPSKWQDDKYYV